MLAEMHVLQNVLFEDKNQMRIYTYGTAHLSKYLSKDYWINSEHLYCQIGDGNRITRIWGEKIQAKFLVQMFSKLG